MRTLKNLFLDELSDRYDAEKRLVIALPKMIKTATCTNLQKLLQAHFEETQGHVKTLERVFKSIGEKARTKKCEATIGLLKEGAEIAADNKGWPVLNAALISVAQKIEHYEIATYGCLREWAALLGNTEAALLLTEILDEEKAANQALIELACSRTNREGLGAGSPADAFESARDIKTLNRRRSVRPFTTNRIRHVLVGR
jgi:ferritin-like metal-binding protein YciE